MKEDLDNLALSMNTYAMYLDEKNTDQQKRQQLSHPVRQIAEYTWLETRESSEVIENQYSILDNSITKLSNYTYICFDEQSHVVAPFKHSMEKTRFINNLRLSLPVNILTYNPGGSVGLILFIWSVPKDRLPQEIANSSIEVFEKLRHLLPEYHTHEMKKQFSKRFCNLHASPNIPPHILRAIYSELTCDASALQNPTLDSRVRQAILSEDSELVLDMRHLNRGRPNDTFTSFFEALIKKVETITAADERRHNVCHISEYISIPDLIRDVSKDLPDNTPIPSKSTVLFSLVPKNSHCKSSKLYTSKVPLQFKIQTSQLRSSHVDEHYCCAIFKYMRQYAMEFKDLVTFLCVDDKSKVDFGEPGQAVSSGVRGKKSIVAVNSMLSALDHDQGTKGSLTPSVCLYV